MIRKVFLENLPRWSKYTNVDRINWKDSVGYKVKFIYDDIEGEIEIIDYHTKQQKLEVKYNNEYFIIKTYDLLSCGLSELLGKHTKKYKYNVKDIIQTKSGKIEILEQIRILNNKNTTQKGYKYKCLIDNNIDEISEVKLKEGRGCNVCSNTKVLKGVNDLWTTHPEVAELLKYPDIGYQIPYGTIKKEIFVCPNCGYEKSIAIHKVVYYNFICNKCGDGISYPNKIGFNLLEQLDIEFIPEYKFDNYKLDFYFEKNGIIYDLEMDGGLGHGHENRMTGQTAEETKAIDEERDKIIRESNVENIEIIRIDCFRSDLEYIKKNILNSKLATIFNLSNVNWLKCHEYACNSLVKVVSDFWNNGTKSTIEIGEILKLNKTTIIRYLKQGKKLGWCNYDPKDSHLEALRKGRNTSLRKKRKKIVQLTLDGKFIKEWNSIKKAEKELNILGISNCCNVDKQNKSAGDFNWMFIDDYYNNIGNIEPVKRITDGGKQKPVVQLDLDGNFISEWNSLSEADRKTGTSFKNISLCCLNKRKTAGGFKWMYKEDYELLHNISNLQTT